MESALKYFLVQAFASLIFISSTLSLSFHQEAPYLLLTLALLIKTGAAPFHQWVPTTLEGLSWGPVYLVLTIQKFIPLAMLSFIVTLQGASACFTCFVVTSALVGSVGGLNQTSLRKILAYSSITHISWLLRALSFARSSWLFYFTFYWLMLLSVINLLVIGQMSTISCLYIKKKKLVRTLTVINFLSLGGLPPFTGFVPKLIVISELMSCGRMFMLLPLLTGSLVRLYYYLNMAASFLLETSSANSVNTLSKSLSPVTLVLNVLGLALPTVFVATLLNFKLSKLRAFKALNKKVLSLQSLS